MRAIELDVVQGIGDTYWVWQKLSPHVDKFRFNILTTDDNIIQNRAKSFLELLDKVDYVSIKRVSQEEYSRVCSSRRSVEEVLQTGGSYAVNRPLEEGIRLEEIDPAKWSVEWTPGLNISKIKAPEYSILYVSGSEPEHTRVWAPEEWAKVYLSFRRSKSPTLLLGAPYDDRMLHRVRNALRALGHDAEIESCTTIANACRYLRDCSEYMGFQSGLGIIADSFDRRQVMIDFNFLRPMKYSWCKKPHINTLFNAYTFDEGSEAVSCAVQKL